MFIAASTTLEPRGSADIVETSIFTIYMLCEMKVLAAALPDKHYLHATTICVCGGGWRGGRKMRAGSEEGGGG